VLSAGIPISVLTFNVTGGQIAGICIISNPQKLRHLTQVRSERPALSKHQVRRAGETQQTEGDL
jgi:hypothetical protein